MKRPAFAPVVKKVTELLFGPEPVGSAMARVQGYYRAQQLGPGNGIPVFGMRGDAATTWAGWTQSPQVFIGQAQMGSIPGAAVPVYPDTALPSASAPKGLPGWLAQYESLQSLAAGGVG